MFWLIRLIFLVSILGMGYSWYQWKRTHEVRWHIHFKNLLRGTLTFVVFIVVILVATRLL